MENFEAFKCPVCNDFMEEPRLLPLCGHSLCKECLSILIGRRSEDFIICPECDRPNYVNSISCMFCFSLFFLNTKLSFNSFVKGCYKNQSLINAGEEFVDKIEKRKKMEILKTIGSFCPHVEFCESFDLTRCSHCESDFCDNCLLAHKVFMKMEIEITKSSVSSFRTIKSF